MSDYKVNLPKTSFPMKADLAKREPQFLKFWQEIGLYEKCLNRKGGKGKFILHDGPPYANGDIHLGQAFNKVLKDIIIKSKILDGYSAPYVPGWDCHGLPIEIKVEKEIGRVGEKANLEDFVQYCRDYAAKQIDSQLETFKRLGVLGDWQNPYRTMEFTYEANIVRALANIIDNGYVDYGFKPVYWCSACGSALAEAEVEYYDKTSPAIDVRFRVVDSSRFKVSAVTIPIWTTTPWTLPANEAVALHPNLTYVLVNCAPKFSDHLLIIENLLPEVRQRYQVENFQIVARFLGKELEGTQLKHPFLADKTVPVVLGEHVTTDAGTGAVHTAPAHGQEDFLVGKKYNLPLKNPVGADSKFLPDTPFFAGLEVFAANEKVIELLRSQDNLLHFESIQHSYPHCWRHKTPLIFLATQQWFIRMDKKNKQGLTLREKAIAEIEKVNWIPGRGKDRILDMISGRPDWCISRQRVWGAPIAIFVHKTTKQLHPEWRKLMEIVAQNIEKVGIIYWLQLKGEEFLIEHAPSFPASEYQKVTDTLDVWFDSGVSHYCVLRNREELRVPADLYLEGIDQYRGWFQSSLLTAVALYDHAPYLAVMSHGFTVDGDGRKMSKSLGNVIAPWKIIDSMGADIFRLWVAATYFHDDLSASNEIFLRQVDTYRMLRNTARFLLGNLNDFNPEQDLVKVTDLLSLDRNAVKKALLLQEKFVQHYRNDYQLHLACNFMQGFISVDLSSVYFSIIKDRLYTMAPKSFGRRSAQTALFHILEILVRCLAPILTFTSEEIWQELKKISPDRAESIFLASWYEGVSLELFNPNHENISEHDWTTIYAVREVVYRELEKLRAAGIIGSSLEAEVVVYLDEEKYASLAKLSDELKFVFITSAATVRPLVERSGSDEIITTEIPEVFLSVKKSTQQKCDRCWHYREDVGANAEHPTICGRCLANVVGDGEQREFV